MRDAARALLAPLLLLVASSACDSSDSGGGGRTDFNAFVREQIDATADNTDPVSLDGIEFRFDEDPDAFDDLFP